MFIAVLRMGSRLKIADGDADGVELAVGQLVLVMPIGVGFRRRQTLALDGMADDRGGFARNGRDLFSTVRRAPTSWPLSSCTAKPKLRHLSASGSR
ncbi:hypothetical protein, partial [Bradyrhizobium liaoningense]|uniref:hypothetical protein n=1 Tax=Bradyrhizobium liaoningense TaxID=43992 RepID=UPI001AEC4274